MENQSWHQNRKIKDDSVKTEHRDNTVVIIRDNSLYQPTKIRFWNDRDNPSFIFSKCVGISLPKNGSVTVNQGRFQASTCLFLRNKIVGIPVYLIGMRRSWPRSG